MAINATRRDAASTLWNLATSIRRNQSLISPAICRTGGRSAACTSSLFALPIPCRRSDCDNGSPSATIGLPAIRRLTPPNSTVSTMTDLRSDCNTGSIRATVPRLRDEKAKSIVENSLGHFDGERYQLDEFIVMPNHVHALVTPLPPHKLSDILHSWKSFTAKEINRLFGRTGALWRKESFDHIVRSPESLRHFRQYIRDNPRRSGVPPLDRKKQHGDPPHQ